MENKLARLIKKIPSSICLITILVLFFCLSLLFGKHFSYQESYHRILDKIDYRLVKDSDVLLVLAKAYTNKYKFGQQSDDKLKLENILSRLEEMAYLNSNDKIGWGLSYAWDAFRDNSVNPQNTIYTSTTASAGLTFLDAYEVTKNDYYLEIAQKATRTLLDDTCCWHEGENVSVWYSNQSVDQLGAQYVVHNTNALTVALLKRLEGYAEKSDLTEQFFAYLLSQQGVKQNLADLPEWNWRYSLFNNDNNDLIHLMFIVEPLLLDDRTQDLAYHILDEAGKDFFKRNGQPLDEEKTLGSRGWGPAAYLTAISCRGGFEPQAKRLADYIAKETFKIDLTKINYDKSDSNNEANLDKLVWNALSLVKYDSCQKS